MKLATLTCVAGVLAFGIGAAHAATEGTPLDADKCKEAWKMASPNGESISKDKAVDYVINYNMVDSNADAKVDSKEFQAACSKGMVKADAATVKDMQ
jgi:hypothetical protein